MGTPAAPLAVQLRALATAVFAAAKRWLLVALVAGLLAVAVAILAALLPESAAPSLAIVSALLTVGAYIAFRKQEERYWVGAEIQRYERFVDGLGWHVPGTTLAAIRAEAGPKACQAVDDIDFGQDVYAADENIGPRRLLHLVDESAFWTYRLFEALRADLLVGFGLAFASALVILVVSAVAFESRDERLSALKFVLVFIPAVVSLVLLHRRGVAQRGRLEGGSGPH